MKNGAVLTPPSSQTIGTLLVASNGWMSIASQSLTVTGNATIQAGGGIIADSTGSAGGIGLGAGKYAPPPPATSGAAAAMVVMEPAGGAPSTYSAYGGSTYGVLTAPIDPGSGGGTYSTLAIGGAGGGLHPSQRDWGAASGWANLGGGRAGDDPQRGRRVRRGYFSDRWHALRLGEPSPPMVGMAITLAAAAAADASPSRMGSMTSPGPFPLTAAAAMPGAAQGPSMPRPIARTGAW